MRWAPSRRATDFYSRAPGPHPRCELTLMPYEALSFPYSRGAPASLASDTRWLFKPLSPWEAGEYEIVALSILEDPAGNRIGRAFEVDMTKARADAAPEAYRLAFKIGETGS